MTITTLLLFLAFVLLALAAAKCPEPARFSFGWGGLAVWMLATVLGGVRI